MCRYATGQAGWVRSFVLTAMAALGLLAGAAPASAAFPGANGRIAFQGFQRLATINAGGGERTPLIAQPGSVFASPAYSPDGQRIAFASNRDGNFEIYVINADGTGLRRLTNNPAEEGSPAWSLDGLRIAFETDRDGNFEIYAMNADGTGAVRLTADLREDHSPAWSPDGASIAFTRVTPTGMEDIWRMGSNGAAPTPLTTASAVEDNPDWAPDGSRIAFQRDDAIVLMRPDGGGQTPLPVNGARPAWAPDGTRIAYDFQSELYSVRPDGGGILQLSSAGTTDLVASNPSWQPIPLPPPPPPPPPPSGGGPSAPPPPAPAEALDPPISTLWQAARRWTRVLRLTVRNVPAGARVEVRCTGRGCPVERRRVRVRKGRANVQAVFKRRRLRPGAVIEIRITKPAAVGKVVRYTIRRGKLPAGRRLCIQPGARRPTRC